MRTFLISGMLLVSACELVPEADYEFTGASPYEGSYGGTVEEKGRKPADANFKLVLKEEVAAFVPDSQTFNADFELKSDLSMGVGFLCGGTKTIKKQTWELQATVTADSKVSGSKTLDVDGNEVVATFSGTISQDPGKADSLKADLDIVFNITNPACTDPALKGAFTKRK